MFFNMTRYGEVSFQIFLKKITPNELEKIVSSHYEEEKAPAEFVSKVEEYSPYFFIK